MAPQAARVRPLSAVRGALTAVAAVMLIVGGAGVVARTVLPIDPEFPARALSLFAVLMLVALGSLAAHHPFPRFGPANQVTTLRAGLLALVAALAWDTGVVDASGAAVAAALIIVALDGVDGWLARRSRLASPFGARFDMEIDAALILALSAVAWRSEKAGAWILLAGLLRYLFVAAAAVWPWMARPLPPRWRRQAVCVVQIVGLALVITPAVVPPLSTAIAVATLGLLVWSFLVDVVWLRRHRRDEDSTTGPAEAGPYVQLAGALLLLNASLTFQNVWPTPWMTWHVEASVELAAAVLIAAWAAARGARLSRAGVTLASAAWLFLVLWRYVDVTAPALWGRELNLFWDTRFIPDVAAMFVQAVPLWVDAATVAVLMAVLGLLMVVVRWAVGRVAEALQRPRDRRVMSAWAASAMVVFAAQRASGVPPLPAFATPVIVSVGRQAMLVYNSVTGARSPAPGPPMDSDLSRVAGADVLLIFVESYGAIAYDNPAFAHDLAASRAEVDAAIRDTGRDVVSAFAVSPTFGGSSWLAHVSFMSGVEVADPDTNALLMAEKRDTLVTTFARGGYRTVGLMPGLWYQWPEGAFYRFNDIYDGKWFDYRGPPFGWWSMSDQFVLAALARELDRRPRPPLFVFFPTITTHAPFSPTPPYQPDWARMLTPTPYDPADLARTDEDYANWMDLSPGYVRSVNYFYQTLAGFLREREGDDLVLLVIGDHQPAAAVTGEGAPWDVPVHIIASRPGILERLTAHGFSAGLTPARPVLGRLHELLPVMLEAFGDAVPATPDLKVGPASD